MFEEKEKEITDPIVEQAHQIDVKKAAEELKTLPPEEYLLLKQELEALRDQVTMPEAGGVVSTFMRGAHGAEILVVDRASSSLIAWNRLEGTIRVLAARGFRPVIKYPDQTKQGQPAPDQEAAEDEMQEDAAQYKTCTIHNMQMRRREKDGQVWYSHKAPDGSWCNGGTQKAKAKS